MLELKHVQRVGDVHQVIAYVHLLAHSQGDGLGDQPREGAVDDAHPGCVKNEYARPGQEGKEGSLYRDGFNMASTDLHWSRACYILDAHVTHIPQLKNIQIKFFSNFFLKQIFCSEFV